MNEARQLVGSEFLIHRISMASWKYWKRLTAPAVPGADVDGVVQEKS